MKLWTQGDKFFVKRGTRHGYNRPKDTLSEVSRLKDKRLMNLLTTFGWILLFLWSLEVLLFLVSYRQRKSS